MNNNIAQRGQKKETKDEDLKKGDVSEDVESRKIMPKKKKSKKKFVE